MSRQQAFEAIYAKQHDVPAESLVQYRHKSKEGYNLPGIASHYRTYCDALDSIAVECDQLKAEVERLKEEYDKAWRHDLNDKNNVQVLAAEVEALRSQVATLQSDANSWQSGYDEGRRIGTKTALDEREQLRKDADRYRWLRVNEFDIGSYHPEGDHNHESWFEHFDDESIDRSIAEEAEFAAESIVKGAKP